MLYRNFFQFTQHKCNTLNGFQVRFDVDPAGDTCSRTSTQQGKRAPKPRGHFSGAKTHWETRRLEDFDPTGEAPGGASGRQATRTLTGLQVRFHVDLMGDASARGFRTGETPAGASGRGHLPGSNLDSILYAMGDTTARGLRPNWGGFAWSTRTIPWKPHINMDANMEPNRYVSHGDFPHTLKARNQHGNQHGSQSKTPLSELRERSLAARLCMCGFGLQPKLTWNPTDIKKHKLNLVMKEPYHSSPPMSAFYWQTAWHQKKKKTSKRNPFPLGWDGEAYFGACCAAQPWFFLGPVAFGECFPQHAWVESGLVFFLAYQTPGTRKLTWNLNGHFVGGSEQQKKQHVKNKSGIWMDLGILVFLYTW